MYSNPISRCSAKLPHSRSMKACTTWNTPATSSSAPMKITPAMVNAITSNQATTPSTSCTMPSPTNQPQPSRGRRPRLDAVRSLMRQTLTTRAVLWQPTPAIHPGRALVSVRPPAYASACPDNGRQGRSEATHDRSKFGLARGDAPVMTVAAATGELRKAPATAMLLGVLGVVYGDIGTSPLYAVKASLQHFPPSIVTNSKSWASCRSSSGRSCLS